MPILFVLLFFASGMLLTQVVFEWRQRALARARLQVRVAEKPKAQTLAERFNEASKGLAAWVDARLPLNLKQGFQAALAKAAWEGWTPGRLVVTQAFAGLAFFLVFTLLLDPGLTGFVAGIGGFCLPLISLYDAGERRSKAMRLALPDALDLLTSCVEAGLSFDLGLARVSSRMAQGPLRQELEWALSEMRMGQTRREALKALAKRVGLEDMSSLVSALLQADQMGVPLGPALRAQSLQMRALRSLRAQKAAAQAPIKMLFPLMAFIMPVIFMVLFGPILIKWVQGGF